VIEESIEMDAGWKELARWAIDLKRMLPEVGLGSVVLLVSSVLNRISS